MVGEEDSSLQGECRNDVSAKTDRVSFNVPEEYRGSKWSDFCAFVDPLDGTKEFCLSNFEAVNVLIGVTFKVSQF